MPLVLWPVHPSYLFRNNDIANDTDCLRAQRLHGLTNILRQMSSISNNIEDIFTGISADMESIQLRTSEISSRVERLRAASKNALIVETTLDPELKEWAMNIKIGAPTVARNTLPEPIEKLYNSCVPMPALEKLDRFNESGSKCLSFYSKPEFFFEQWITSFDKDIALKQEKRMKKKEDRKAANKIRKYSSKSSLSEKVKPTITHENITHFEPVNEHAEMELIKNDASPMKKPSGIGAKPMPTHVDDVKVAPTSFEEANEFVGVEPPSDDSIMNEPLCITPPDIEPLRINATPTAVAPSDSNLYKVNEVKAPAPPPPPPPPVSIMQVSTPAPPVPSAAPKAAAPAGGQMDLLSSIRLGKDLKTVKIEEKKEVEQYAGNDVASILARRIQLAGESDSEESGEDDGDDWD